MARVSEKFYNAYGGLDSRTNPLKQNAMYARDGYNFRWNFQDALQKMNGFQKKIPSVGSECGLAEYKFNNVDTGEAVSEILGVDASGNLNVLRSHFLRLTKAGGSVTSYSLFYDNTGTPSWKIVFYNVTGVVLGSVSFPETDTIIDLSGDINALALTGLTSSVVDKNGVVVISTTCLAYTLDTVISETVSTGVNQNPAWFWERVVFPDSTDVPFPMVISQANNPDYEGITFINQNNSLYITAGSWVMKYDGFQVSRAGMPEMIGPSIGGNTNSAGFEFTPQSGSDWTEGRHAVRFQYCYVDPNGVQVNGMVQPNGIAFGQTPTSFELISPNLTTNLFVPSIAQDHTFPIYACQIDGNQTILGVPTPQTFNIDPDHNLKVGQALRVHNFGSPGGLVNDEEIFYLEITGITATTVTITGWPLATTFSLDDDLIFNACYMPRNLMGRIQSVRGSQPVYGPYIRMMATQVLSTSIGEQVIDPFYVFQGFLPVPAITQQEYTIPSVGIGDSAMAALFAMFEEDDPFEVGAALPRACRYLSKWQQTLIQSGRTYDPLLAQAYYPAIYDPAAILAANDNSIAAERLVTNDESMLCDYQSIYWADSSVPEGFPQDGLHEFLIETPFNDEMRGMSPNKDSFFAFKDRSTAYLTGSLAENSVQMELMESDAGCACHKAIAEVAGAVFYMDANSGFWSVVAGRLPEFIGYGVQNFFKDSSGLNFRKAWAANFRFQDQYICFIPGTADRIFVYDYSPTATGNRSAWYPWTGMNGGAGVLATSNDELLFSSANTPTLWLQKFTGTKYDYSIHTSPVPFSYVQSWVNFGFPTIDKKFVKVWLNSVQGGFDILVKQFANYLAPEITSFTISFPVEDVDKLTVKNWMELSEDKLSATSVSFENNDIYADVQIQGWEIEYAPGFDPAEARE